VHSALGSELYPLSLHDALPILVFKMGKISVLLIPGIIGATITCVGIPSSDSVSNAFNFVFTDEVLGSKTLRKSSLIVGMLNETRSEEHTSELQSRENLVCRLLL